MQMVMCMFVNELNIVYQFTSLLVATHKYLHLSEQEHIIIMRSWSETLLLYVDVVYL